MKASPFVLRRREIKLKYNGELVGLHGCAARSANVGKQLAIKEYAIYSPHNPWL